MSVSNPDRLAYYLLKSVSKAQRLYGLFASGDRIAVAVSGGKDSATLLELLRRWPGVPRLELRAVHVMAGGACGGGVGDAVLQAWWRQLGIEGVSVPAERLEPPQSGRPAGPCFPCAMGRRKALFQAAHALGCNKVALGHHADDVAVTTLLNLVFQGRCETMPPTVDLFAGALTLIRPLYLVEEREIVRFVRSGVLPFTPSTCVRGVDQRRERMGEVLRTLERENRRVKRTLLNAVERAAKLEALRDEGLVESWTNE